MLPFKQTGGSEVYLLMGKPKIGKKILLEKKLASSLREIVSYWPDRTDQNCFRTEIPASRYLLAG
jgi:hypothetical protein